MGYGDIRRPQLAEALNVSASTLDRWTKGTTGKWRNIGWGDLWIVADTCGVPREWFSADIGRLREIVPPDQPRFDVSQRAAGVEAAQTAREAARLRRERPERAPASQPGRDATGTRS